MPDYSTETARAVITDALRKIRVVAQDEAMTADQAAIGLRALDRMLKSWQNHGDLLWSVEPKTSLDDVVDVPVGFEEAVVYCLGANLTDDFQVDAPNVVGRAAMELKLALAADRENSVYFLPTGYETDYYEG